MRLVAFDPFVNDERARQLGVQLVPTIEELFATSDFVTIHATKTPQTIGLVNAAVLDARQAGPAPDQRRARRHRRRGRARRRARERASSAAPPSTRSRPNRQPSRRCSHSTTSSSRRTSARPPRKPRTRRASRSPSRSCSHCEATSCRSPSTSPRPRRRRRCARSSRSPNASAGCSPVSPSGALESLEVTYEGEIADYDCRVLTLSVLQGRARARSSTSRSRSSTRRSSPKNAASPFARRHRPTRATT